MYSTCYKLSNIILLRTIGTNIMHKHYTSQSAHGCDLEVQLIKNSRQYFCFSVLFLCHVTILLILFIGIIKESMHLLASLSINFELSAILLWHKIAFFFTAFDSYSVETVSVVSLQFPMGDCLIQGLTVCFFFINHCYSTLILFFLLFRKEIKSNKLSSNWSSSFWSLTHHQKTYQQKI